MNAVPHAIRPEFRADAPSFDVMDPATGFTPEGTVELGVGFDLRPERPRFLPSARTLALGTWRLRGVTLDPLTTLAFRDAVPVEETRYVVYEAHEAQARARLGLADPAPPLTGRVFQGYTWLLQNYYHWLVQCVPALAAYARDPAFASGRVLLPPLTAPQARALELAGIRLPERPPWSTRPVAVADLSVSTLLGAHEAPSPFCAGVYRRMADALGPVPRRHRRLYVWRVDSRARPMVNEVDLVELLDRYGVEPVVLSGCTFDEQIQMFREASLVIGPHGAGLANIVFCQPGTTVYELLPDHYVNPCFNRLAQMAGLAYHADLHRADARPDLWRHQTPWTVDLAAFERRLKAILGTQPSLVA